VVNGPNGPGNHDGPSSTNASNQSYPTNSRGMAVSGMSTSQKALVKTVIEAWVNNLPTATASSLLADYESDTSMNATYVGMSSSADFSSTAGDSSIGSYFRVDGPRVWIEFVVQDGYPISTSDGKIHYHTIWRDKTTDYGAEF